MEARWEGLQFYRCTLCQGVVSVWDINEQHGCPKCAGTRMMPTNLSIKEKLVQMLKHPRLGEWKNVQIK